MIISLNGKAMAELGPKKLASMLNVRPLEMTVDRGIPIGKELLAARSTLEVTPEEEAEWAEQARSRKGKRGSQRGSGTGSSGPPVRSSITYKSNTKTGRRGSSHEGGGKRGSALARRASTVGGKAAGGGRGSSKSPARSVSPSSREIIVEATLEGLRLGADIRSSMGGAEISSVDL